MKNISLIAVLTVVGVLASSAIPGGQAAFAASKKTKKKTTQKAAQNQEPAPVYRNYSPTPERKFGLGIVFGQPTGFTGKYWMDHNTAIDGTVAYSFGSWLMLYADYLYHFRNVFSGNYGSATEFLTHLNPYIGGGVLGFFSVGTYSADRGFYSEKSTGAGLGLRIPLGAEWMPAKPPIGVFLELVPGVGIAPSTFGFFQAGIGIRYYFE